MKRRVLPALLVCAALLFGLPTAGRSTVITAPSPWVPLGYQQITSLGTAVGLTVPATANLAVITVEVQSIRWRDDGVAPTTTVGMLVTSGTTINYTGDLTAFKVIAVTGSPVLDVSYYRTW